MPLSGPEKGCQSACLRERVWLRFLEQVVYYIHRGDAVRVGIEVSHDPVAKNGNRHTADILDERG